jgi:uncharacterized protein YjbI with pentapeptide repeats
MTGVIMRKDEQADLTKANLQEAFLHEGNLQKTDLTGANLQSHAWMIFASLLRILPTSAGDRLCALISARSC